MSSELVKLKQAGKELVQLSEKYLAAATEYLYFVEVMYDELDEKDIIDLIGFLRLSLDPIGTVKGQMVTASDGMCKTIGRKIARRAMNDPSELDPIRGQFATASLMLTALPRIPGRKDTSGAYDAALNYFGVVDEEVIRAGVINLHYTRLAEWLDARKEEGKPVPEEFVVTRMPTLRVTTFKDRLNDEIKS